MAGFAPRIDVRRSVVLAKAGGWLGALWQIDGRENLLSNAAGLNESNTLTCEEGYWSKFESSVQATLVHGANLQIDFGISEERPRRTISPVRSP